MITVLTKFAHQSQCGRMAMVLAAPLEAKHAGQAWQAHLAGSTHPNSLLLDSSSARKHKPKIAALPFGTMWAAIWQHCERMAKQRQAQNRSRAGQAALP